MRISNCTAAMRILRRGDLKVTCYHWPYCHRAGWFVYAFMLGTQCNFILMHASKKFEVHSYGW
jgi:hypothetical protein